MKEETHENQTIHTEFHFFNLGTDQFIIWELYPAICYVDVCIGTDGFRVHLRGIAGLVHAADDSALPSGRNLADRANRRNIMVILE